ncbi:FAD-binding protein [Dehalococcoidia bacterium]|nr:FAD-binding protein [Dehalococcoidia bacterium]MCL0064526.1 FAD-binding protein [Dehalococcoidia bacterium]MCL0090947.1 FAD-binding protein [Dehalococcoidia bacterium]
MTRRYDVVVVGSGPAGIFTALELAQSSDLNILLLEKGKALGNRHCPSIDNHSDCRSCSPCGMVSGWGGAGAFSDGKLTLSLDVGGRLKRYLGPQRTEELIGYVDQRYLEFGGPDRLYGLGPEVEQLRQKAGLAGLRLIPVAIRHLGTEHCRVVLQRMHDFLANRVEMRSGTAVTSIVARDGKIKGIETEDGESIETRYLVVAPGREGSDWLVREAALLGLTKHNNPVDLGLRVEVPQAVLRSLTDVLYESKLEFYSRAFKDRIRTFCVCPAGEVTMESTGGTDPVITVNGHSYAARKTDRTNFALLGSATFSKPFNDPIAYGRSVARLANILSGGVILQRLGDLRKGRCSTLAGMEKWAVQPTLGSATPGDISAVLPYRFLKGIKEMLTAMDRLVPGIASPHTLLYGIEVKFYSSRLQLTQHLETEIANMFAIGDGAGVSRGLVQASASGVVAAREILRRG